MRESIKKRIDAVRSGEVPEGYRRTRAGLMPLDWQEDLAAKDVFRNYTNKKHNGEFHVLSATQDRGIIPRSEVEIDIKFAEENVRSYKKVDVGDFVISLRSFQGGIEYSACEGLVSPAYTVLKATRPISDNYYRAYFKTPDFISRLNGAVYGIRDGKQIGFEDFGELVVHYPPLTEQQKIAEILATCERVIELKQRLLEEKRRQKQWLMQKLMDPNGGLRLPGFKGTWTSMQFGEIVTRSKNMISAPKCKKGTKCIELEHIEGGSGRLLGYCNAETQESNKCQFSTGDILFGKLRPYLQKAVKAPFDGVCSSEIWVLRPCLDALCNDYLFYIVQSKQFMLVANTSSGTKMPRAEWSMVQNFVVELPTIAEQKAIANVLAAADQEITLLNAELEVWQQKKKALMQLLLTGLVRVNT